MSTLGKSIEISFSLLPGGKPEIFALDVSNGPLSLMSNLAIFEFGILKPNVRSLLGNNGLLCSEIGITIVNGTSAIGSIFFADGTSANGRGRIRYQHSNDSLILATAETTALTLDSSQNATFAGTVSDSIGELRKIPNNATTSAYTLSSSDVGKAVTNTSGGVTVPNGVFAGGSAVTIINHSGSDITITQASGLTLHNAADAATGNRTLAARGMATIWFQASSVAYISGAGLS